MDKDIVLEFISNFTKISKNNDIIDVFTCGCCYWFAYILRGKFIDAKMMYDPIYNHFMVEINNQLYDITGNITNKYNPVIWEHFDDELERQRIVEYCIEFQK